jgi:hypothetical protein
MPRDRAFAIRVNAAKINLFSDELVLILVEYLLVVNGIVVDFPVAGIGNIKTPSMPEGIVRKRVVIFHGCPLGIAIDQPYVELIIPSRDIPSQKFHAIIQTVRIQAKII